jgi:hypothetical protein
MTQIFTGKPQNPIEAPEVSQPESVNGGYYDQNYTMQNISFSGADAVVTIVLPNIGPDSSSTSTGDVIELGELQTLSYSIHRENSPIRTLGHVNPRGFIKGGRTIAGSLIFAVFNEYAFYRIKKYREFLSRKNGFFAPLADMLPPFDIVITLFNEYGQYAKMKIYGVTIIDEGQTLSIDDLFIEQTYTFMARGIQPIVKMTQEKDSNSTSNPELDARDLQISRNIFGDQVIDDLAKLYNSNMIEETVEP